MITNPRLIETGLDLLEFPSIIYFQTGYSTFTLRQSSRRSWRIGQKEDVHVYYMTYAGTAQATALSLMADKMQVALAVEGNLSDAGLTALAEGDASIMVKMAKTLIGEEKAPVKTPGEMFGDLGETNLRSEVRLDDLNNTPERTTTITIKDDDGREKTIVVEKVVRGRVKPMPEKQMAIATIEGTGAQFVFSNGIVTFNNKTIGEYQKNGTGRINGKLIHLYPADDGEYSLIELRRVNQ